MLKIILLSGLIISAVTLTSVTGADAHGGGKRNMPSFLELDANQDGNLSMEELQAFGQGRFDHADTNGDGILTREELTEQAQARIDGHVDRMIERKDSDGDGALSSEELRGGHDRGNRIFEHADADSDGLISEEEFKAAMARGKQHRRWLHQN